MTSEEERGRARRLAEVYHFCGQSGFGADAVGEAYLTIFEARGLVALDVKLVKDRRGALEKWAFGRSGNFH